MAFQLMAMLRVGFVMTQQRVSALMAGMSLVPIDGHDAAAIA
jgi:hypothetical protein